MAFVIARITVTAAEDIKLAENLAGGAGGDETARSFLLKNVTKTAPIYLGPPGVTAGAAGTGLEWDQSADGSASVDVEAQEVLHGRLAAGAPDQTVHVLSGGR